MSTQQFELNTRPGRVNERSIRKLGEFMYRQVELEVTFPIEENTSVPEFDRVVRQEVNLLKQRLEKHSPSFAVRTFATLLFPRTSDQQPLFRGQVTVWLLTRHISLHYRCLPLDLPVSGLIKVVEALRQGFFADVNFIFKASFRETVSASQSEIEKTFIGLIRAHKVACYVNSFDFWGDQQRGHLMLRFTTPQYGSDRE